MTRGDAHIEVERVDDRTAAVTVHDDPLGATADRLADLVTGLLADGTDRVVVDFAGAGLLNSKLLDALVRASSVAGQRGGIAVVAGQGYVRQVLEISETGGVGLLADSREEALEAVGA